MRPWLSLVLLAACQPLYMRNMPPANPNEPVAKHWRVYGHVMSDQAAVTDEDADQLDGRELAVGYTEYETPFHGRCNEAKVVRKKRGTSEVTQELHIARSGLGVGDDVTEFRMTCTEANKPALVIFVDGDHALTCWAGVCYLLGS